MISTSAKAFVGNTEIDGIRYYVITKGKVATVIAKSSDEKYTGEVEIPGTIVVENVECVVSIGESAFEDCTELTSVKICEGLSKIDYQAFKGCTSLSSLIIEDGVSTIGARAFCDCSSLTSVIIPSSVTEISGGAFTNCTSLTSVTLPKGISSISSCVFMQCSSLKSIVIPDGVVKINDRAFYMCSNLTAVTIPASVTTVNSNAFANCPELKDVFIYAETAPTYEDYNYTNAFTNSLIKYATLHVPNSAITDYKSTTPWSGFGTIVALDLPIIEQCAIPTISFVNGKVSFACETENVEFISIITIGDSEIEQTSNDIDLNSSFSVSVYARREGYLDSPKASATFSMPPKADLNGDGKITIADVTALVNIILGK